MDRFRITWCWPDMLSLHGDRGNAMALERVARQLGLDPEVTRIDRYDDPIDWEGTDLILLNPGEVRTVHRVTEALQAQREGLDRYLESGGVLLAVGTTGAALGRTVRYLDGCVQPGLGILPMDCEERNEVIGDDLIVRIRESGMELAGCQIHLMDARVDAGMELGEVLYGYGSCGYEAGRDGARDRNVFYTNLLGPVLVRNPWWAEQLIRLALARRGIEPGPQEEGAYALERRSYECAHNYCVTEHQRNKSHNPWNRTDR